MASEKLDGIIKTIEEMSVLELADLVKTLEDKFGVSANMPMMAITMRSSMSVKAFVIFNCRLCPP